jgi:hypothetical protein
VDPESDGLAQLAGMLGVPEQELRAAIGAPWRAAENAPYFGHDVRVYVGHENPRHPERPLVVIRVDRDERVVDVGRAVGVPVPGGRQQWSLAEPRTSLDYDEVPLDETWGGGHSAALLLSALGDAVSTVVDAAILRGTTW